MASEKQIEANRANAQKSTGPRTSDGKARSAQNALKHGLTAATPVLPDEDAAAFEALRQRLFEQYQPRVAVGAELVEDLADNLWRLRRVPGIDADILQRDYWESQIHAAEEALRQATPDWALLQTLVDTPSAEEQAAAERVRATRAAAREALTVGATGFLRDARGANMLDTLTRYEAGLANRVRSDMRELERLQAQRVEGELVE